MRERETKSERERKRERKSERERERAKVREEGERRSRREGSKVSPSLVMACFPVFEGSGRSHARPCS